MGQDLQTPGTTSPTLAEFETWPSEKVGPLVADKAAIFSPGGSSRWYFLEHGDASQGYSRPEQFHDYASRTLQRILEIASMMLDDGLRTVFVVGMTPKQSNRGQDYDQYMGWAAGFLVEEMARGLYDRYQMGVLFRGNWKMMLERFKTPDVLQRFHEVEQQTVPGRDRRLVWIVEDDPIPDSLTPLVSQAIQQTGHMPDRAALCQAYYGRPVQHVDLVVCNNKPTIEGQLPPLLTIGDLYFTVSPSMYLERRQWRGILYDHLFSRRGHYRDYTAMGPEVMNGLRDFYTAQQGITLGVGSYHAPSQTWRPILPSMPKPPPGENGSPAG